MPAEARDSAGFRLVVVIFTGLSYAALGTPGARPWMAVGLLGVGAAYALLWLLPAWRSVAWRQPAVSAAADGLLILVWVQVTGGFGSPFFVLWFVAAASLLGWNWRPAVLASGAFASSYLLLLALRGELLSNAAPALARAGFIVLVAGLAGRWVAGPSEASPLRLPRTLRRLGAETTTTGVAHVVVGAAATLPGARAAALHLAPVDDLRTGLGPLRCAAAHELAPGAEQALARLYWNRRERGLDGFRLLAAPGAEPDLDEAAAGWVLGVPVHEAEHVVGVLSMVFGAHEPDAATVDELETLATMAAAAILRVRTRRALEEQKAQFQRLSEAALEGVAIVDGGRVVEANAAFSSLFGYAPEQIVGADILDLVEVTGRGDLAKLLAEGAGVPLRLPGQARDGSRLPIEVVAREYPYQRHRASVLAVRDLTDRLRAEADRKAAEERQREVERLQEISRFRSNLLNAASHELKTPITPLKLQLHLLKSGRLGELAPRQERAVGILDRNLSRLEQLVSDVLDVAHLESGRLILRSRPLDLNPMIFEAVETFDEGAREAGVTLDAHLHGSIWVKADPSRISQVLNNLLSNALKFTPRGGRILVRSGLADGEEGLDAWVRVEDTGIGLAPDQIKRLFQPFSQVHDMMQTSQPGTGLGLYISRGIVERHGGVIACESGGRGLGTTFRFTLPRASAEPPPAGPAQPASAPLVESAVRASGSRVSEGARPGWRGDSEGPRPPA